MRVSQESEPEIRAGPINGGRLRQDWGVTEEEVQALIKLRNVVELSVLRSTAPRVSEQTKAGFEKSLHLMTQRLNQAFVTYDFDRAAEIISEFHKTLRASFHRTCALVEFSPC